MDMISWELGYLAVRARLVASVRLSDQVVADMVSAENVDRAIDYLKETAYYGYIKNVDVRDQLQLETGLWAGVYEDLYKLRLGSHLKFSDVYSVSLAVVESKIVSSLLKYALLGLDPPEYLSSIKSPVVSGLYNVVYEDRSFARGLEFLDTAGYGRVGELYNFFNRYLKDPRRSIDYAMDSLFISYISEAVGYYYSVAHLACLELDQLIVNMIIRSVYDGASDPLKDMEVWRYSCSIDREVFEDLTSYTDDERIIAVLKKLYPAAAGDRNLGIVLASIRGWNRKRLRGACINTLSSYPFDPAAIWASTTLRRLDVEDIIAIIGSKIGLLSSDLVKKMISFAI